MQKYLDNLLKKDFSEPQAIQAHYQPNSSNHICVGEKRRYLQNILWSKHDSSIPGNYIFAEVCLFEGMVGQMSEATFGPLFGVALCIKMYMILWSCAKVIVYSLYNIKHKTEMV